MMTPRKENLPWREHGSVHTLASGIRQLDNEFCRKDEYYNESAAWREASFVFWFRHVRFDLRVSRHKRQ